GKTVVDNLFPGGEDPVGRVVRFGRIPLTVVGVLEPKGTNSMGMDQDDVVLAPYTTVMKRILAIDYIQGIFASAADENTTDRTIEAVSDVLRTRHRIKDGAEDDFDIRSQKERSDMMNSTSDLRSVLLACIAGISLLVGGIGIMNIMYVSVTERTREIGLRMSIGARGADILAQFLIEAVIISVSGGIIGIVTGVVATVLVNVVAHWPVYIRLYSVVLSFAVCTATGVFFGWYPARKAAGLDPIEAIRYE
ncbi:MAG: FtsX-like permease family protein, partial [Muribaculaceae bacterium]|nr:FtsX-like permease family protein [Muribaculaceae bacterium]